MRMRLHPEQMAHKTYFWVLFNYTNKYKEIDADMDK